MQFCAVISRLATGRYSLHYKGVELTPTGMTRVPVLHGSCGQARNLSIFLCGPLILGVSRTMV